MATEMTPNTGEDAAFVAATQAAEISAKDSNDSAARPSAGHTWTRDFSQSQQKRGLDMTAEKLCTSVARAI